MLKKNVVLLVPFLLLVQCVNNVTEMSDDDLIEFESVWQYLNAYSIFQEECSGSGINCKKRLADNPFTYKSPSAMMDSMYDTLKKVRYTKYYQSSGEYASAGSAGAQESRKVDLVGLTSSTAVLRISDFTTDVTYRQFLEVLPNMNNFKNCIIDLRRNPGGDLKELDSILEMFIPAQTDYILARERTRDSTNGTFRTFDYHPWRTSQDASPFLKGKKMVVLMDSNTASAAEILAAALKDCNGAILAGEHSYGKAIGQIRLHRRGRQGLQITFLQLKRITLESYQNTGIAPDSTITVNSSLAEDLRKREYLYKAVRMVEPGVDLMSITIPSALLKTALPKVAAEGYRDIYEE